MKSTSKRRFDMYFGLVVGERYYYDKLAEKYKVKRRTIQSDIKYFKDNKIFFLMPPDYVEGGFQLYKIKNRRDF